MTYTLNIDQPALSLFKKLPATLQRLLLEKAQVLTTKPQTGTSLQGNYRLLRSLHLTLECTAYRFIYQVFERSETIVVRLAAPRKKIYRHLDELKGKP